jgi:8-oxo-dGTP diphosphatase
MRKAARAIVIHNERLLVIHRNKYGKEYYTLPGGGIDAGETAEQAVLRELAEETGVSVALERLVFIENPGKQYGQQEIFLCTYITGTPALHPDSEEAQANLSGQNTYKPLWLPLSKLPHVAFMSPRLQIALQKGIDDSFPAAPETL